jgi:transcriptional regulator with XRE-family HTH domain
MARIGLRWTQDRLAEKSGVNRRSILRYEAGGNIEGESVEALRRALLEGGATFADRAGQTSVSVPR